MMSQQSQMQTNSNAHAAGGNATASGAHPPPSGANHSNMIWMLLLLVVPLLVRAATPKLSMLLVKGFKFRTRPIRTIVCTREVGGWKW